MAHQVRFGARVPTPAGAAAGAPVAPAPFPLTWSQRHMFDIVTKLAGAASLNLSRQVPVPPGTTVDAVLAALRDLVEHHDGLRTTVATGPDGRPCQWVVDDGAFTVEEHEPAPGDLDRLAGEVAFTDVGLDGALPCRFDLVTRDGAPHTVVCTISHLALDGGGLAVLHAELVSRMVGGPSPAPAVTPRERVAYERSDAGRARSRRSLRFVERQLAQAPAALFPESLAAQDSCSRFWVGHLISPALTAAARAFPVVRSTPIVPAVVGVMAALLAGRSRAPAADFVLICSNRFARDLQGYVGTLFMPVPVTVPVPPGTTLLAILSEARTRVMRAHLSGEYDPDDLPALQAAESARRGAALGVPAAVNVHDTPTADVDLLGSDATAGADAIAATVATARGLVDSTAADWRPLGDAEHLPRFYLDVIGRDGVLNLFLRFDTRLVDREAADALLHGLESVLVELLVRDLTVPAALVAAGLGLTIIARALSAMRRSRVDGTFGRFQRSNVPSTRAHPTGWGVAVRAGARGIRRDRTAAMTASPPATYQAGA